MNIGEVLGLILLVAFFGGVFIWGIVRESQIMRDRAESEKRHWKNIEALLCRALHDK